MKVLHKKWPRINILKLYTEGNEQEWNSWLRMCLRKRDVEALKKVRYGLQYDMSELAKAKLNDNRINEMFVRWTRSIEKTVKLIYREVYPNPCDDPLKAKEYTNFLEAKRKRDREFENFLRESAF